MNYNIIISGHFSINGNFIGTNHRKEEIHIGKDQMDSLNLMSVEDIKFPLFAFAKMQIYDRLTGKPGDQNRKVVINSNGIIEKFERLTAYAIYKDFDSFINVFTYPINLNLTIIENRKSIVENAGLTGKIVIPKDLELDEIKDNYLEAEKAFREYFEYKIFSNKYT